MLLFKKNRSQANGSLIEPWEWLLMGTIKEEERLGIKVGRFLQLRGYYFGDSRNIVSNTSDGYSCYSIVLPNCEPSKPKGLFSKIFLALPRRRILGVIWFENSDSRDDVDSENWLLEVKGRDCLGEARKLAKEMVEIFTDVNITIRLESEYGELESFLSDPYG